MTDHDLRLPRNMPGDPLVEDDAEVFVRAVLTHTDVVSAIEAIHLEIIPENADGSGPYG